MEGKWPGVLDLTVPRVDVRDLAKAQYLAMITPGLSGRRISINEAESASSVQVAQWLKEEFSQYGYKIVTNTIPYSDLEKMSHHKEILGWFLPLYGVPMTGSNSLSKELLGIEYRGNYKQTVIDMGYSLIEKGIIADLRNQSPSE